jgi:glycolate oxidase subunit GlcD
MPLEKAIYRALKRILGKDKIRISAESRWVYGADVTKVFHPPSIIIFPETTQDVVSTIQIARQLGLAITPRGAGTGMSGGAVPLANSIALSFERMNQILSIDPEAKIALVEPGVITSKLQDQVAKYNLFYPPDPSSYKACTIGGNIAENAGGLRCLKYGVTADYVLGLEFVNSEGEIVSTGYLDDYRSTFDLTQTLCGSEGLLGIIVKSALRLLEAPTAYITLFIEFPSVHTSANTVTEILNSGYLPSIMELIDRQTLNAITRYMDLEVSPDTNAILLIEFDESPAENRRKGEVVAQMSRKNGARKVKIAENSEERERLWALRRAISPSLTRLASGKINEDVVVPRGRISELCDFIEELSSEIGLTIPTYGHAGDGNLHINFIFDKKREDEVEKAHIGVVKTFRKVTEMGGAISGEHGIGMTKKEYLPIQLSAENLRLQKCVKTVFDQFGVFNPGKVLP